MIVFFDILLLDDDACLRKPHRERRRLLKEVIREINGRAGLAEQQIVDFSRSDGRHRLEKAFHGAIIQRWEGYVLKGCDDPCISLLSVEGDCPGRWIKLKKDYIPGLGDSADFALIGAKYSSRDAAGLNNISKLHWTHFYVGCPVGVEGVAQSNAKAEFRVIDVIGRHSMNSQTMQYLNQMGEFCACSPDADDDIFRVKYGHVNIPHMDVVFKTPFIVELLGSGFEKPSGAGYYTLRFPRILKIHSDRSLEDAVSFPHLQELADKARSAPTEELSQEEEQWAKRMTFSHGRERSSSQSSSSSMSPQSSREGACESSDTGRTAVSPADFDADKENTSNVDSSGLSGNAGHTRTDEIPVARTYNTAMSRMESKTEDCLSTIQKAYGKNLDSVPSKRKRTPEARSNGETYGLLHPMNTVTIHTSPRQGDLGRGRLVGDESTRKTTTLVKQCLKSPITTLPVYLAGSSAKEQYQCRDTLSLLKDAEKTFSCAGFVQRLCSKKCREGLRNSNPYASSQHMMLGLILLDMQEPSLLSTLLIEVSNALADMAYLPPRGKIFFLGLDILGLGLEPADHRFCLRLTWENISKTYFYSCLKWDFRRYTSLGDDGHSLGQIFGSSNDGFALVFDPDEVTTLGEFVSIEPLVHHQDQALTLHYYEQS